MRHVYMKCMQENAVILDIFFIAMERVRVGRNLKFSSHASILIIQIRSASGGFPSLPLDPTEGSAPPIFPYRLSLCAPHLARPLCELDPPVRLLKLWAIQFRLLAPFKSVFCRLITCTCNLEVRHCINRVDNATQYINIRNLNKTRSLDGCFRTRRTIAIVVLTN